MGSGGGGPSTTTTIQKLTPPPYVVGPATAYINALAGLTLPGGKVAPSPYPFEQVAPFAPLQTGALGAVGQLGSISPAAEAALAESAAIAGGQNLDPTTNPFLSKYYDAAARGLVNQYQMATDPGITAGAVQAGGLGGSGQNQLQQYGKWSLAQNLGDLAARVYEPAYETALGQQLGAIQGTPQLVAGQYIPAQQAMQAGGVEQAQLQNVLNTGVSNLSQQALWPWQALQQLGQGVGLAAGTGGTTVQIGPNPYQTVGK